MSARARGSTAIGHQLQSVNHRDIDTDYNEAGHCFCVETTILGVVRWHSRAAPPPHPRFPSLASSARPFAMGTGSRHSKNAGTMGSESLTYHEKKALGFGTITERLGKETVKAFDACALSLTHATDPVVTPEGVLYDREHILRCLLRQKKDIARKLRAWEDQLARDAGEADARAAEAREEAVERFHRAANQAIAADPPGGSDGADDDVSDDDDESDARRASVSAAQVRAATDEKARRAKELNAFWLPSKTPDAAIRLDRKPETHTICPTTGKKLRMKDLTDVKWTKLPPSAAEDAASRWRYMCPVTRETLTDASRVVVLKPSGAAVSEEAYDKVLAREKEWDGRRIRGVVKLQRGGSGFAASGTQVESKKSFLVGAGSGLADSRGQHRGGASKFGLRFN